MTVQEKKPIKRQIAAWIKVCIVIIIFVTTGFLLQAICHIPVAGFVENLFYMKYLPDLEGGANFGILFVFGLLTSIHCVGMCGGLVLSHSIGKTDSSAETGSSPAGKKHVVLPSAVYSAGRLISYTVIGGLTGGLGQTLALSGVLKGLIPIIGGIFMILMAINMLGIFAGLRRLHFGLPKGLLKKLGIGKPGYRSPFIVGLLTGLMPCGPMQIIQIYALGTKSILIGAVSMLVFALGTMPGLFGFGVIGSYISKGASKHILRVSAFLVAVLGVVMLSRGMALMGVQILPETRDSEYVRSQINGEVQTVSIELQSGSFQAIEVYEGIPVEWIIHADQENLNDCNNEIIVPEYDLDIKLEAGDTLASFTPEEQGEYVYTCWMGMIKSKIRVVGNPDPDNIKRTAPDDSAAAKDPQIPADQMEAAKQTLGAAREVPSNQTMPCTMPAQETASAKAPIPSASSYTPVTSLSAQPDVTSSDTSVIPAAQPAPDNSGTVSSFTGYLIDTDCLPLYTDPSEETRSCLLMDSCAASGYGISFQDGEGNTVFYLFDGNIAGNPYDTTRPSSGGQLLAHSFLTSNISDGNRSVTVEGTVSADTFTGAAGQIYPILVVSSITLLT